MTDGHYEITGRFVMINAVDHAASAEREALARIILSTTGDGVAEFKKTITIEDQTMGGSFGHDPEFTTIHRAMTPKSP
jgi:hypothetical protein